MHILILFPLLFCCVSLVTSEEEFEYKKKCPFQATVDLTNQTRYDNGSYSYQNILIPIEEQDFYEYHYRFRSEKIPVKQHLRGCVCTETKPCIKLCCQKNELFNAGSGVCEILPESSEVSWILPINDTKVNVLDKFIYQVGLPCNYLESLAFDDLEWKLLENGYLYIDYEQVKLDTLNYCFSPYSFEETNEFSLVPYGCPAPNEATWRMILNTYAMATSLVFLIPTTILYLALRELRDNLKGKLLTCFFLSLTVAYGVISFINIYIIRFEYFVCSLLGFTCYYFFMAAYLWLNVLCYYVWCHFHAINSKLDPQDDNKRFVYYSLFTWIFAAIFTGLLIFVEISNNIPDIFKGDIGVVMCFLNTNKWSAAIYFYGPQLIMLSLNLAAFAYSAAQIYKVRQNVSNLTSKKYFFLENAKVILRLFLLMGFYFFTWSFDILSYILRNYKNAEWIFTAADLATATDGVLIFTLFVLNQNVLDLLKKRFKKIKGFLRCIQQKHDDDDISLPSTIPRNDNSIHLAVHTEYNAVRETSKTTMIF